MTCREFSAAWNDWLDRVTTATPSQDSSAPEFQALIEHARECDDCRVAHDHLQQLARGLGAWLLVERQAIVPSQDFTARLLQTLLHEQRVNARFKSGRPLVLRFAAAATVVAAIGGGVALWLPWRHFEAPDRGSELARRAAPQPQAQRLERAVAQATQATIELAMLSAEPAARVSRSVFRSNPPLAEVPSVATGALSLTTEPVLSSLEGVGAQLSETVEPLSGSARQAFGFLWPISPRDSKAASPKEADRESDSSKRSS